MSATISYYELHAKEFFEDTKDANMEPHYRLFLSKIPFGGRLLDAGCGSGRDTRYFLQQGYSVDAFDASSKMCALASLHTGLVVEQRTFEELNCDATYDGVWACASVLHVPKDRVLSTVSRLTTALKIGGVLYLSFKNRDGEWVEGGRSFTGFTTDSFQDLIMGLPWLHAIETWTSNDNRPQRSETWLNVLVRKESTTLQTATL